MYAKDWESGTVSVLNENMALRLVAIASKVIELNYLKLPRVIEPSVP